APAHRRAEARRRDGCAVLRRVSRQLAKLFIEDAHARLGVLAGAVEVQADAGGLAFEVDGRGDAMGVFPGAPDRGEEPEPVAAPGGDANALAVVLGPGRVPEQSFVADVFKALALD